MTDSEQSLKFLEQFIEKDLRIGKHDGTFTLRFDDTNPSKEQGESLLRTCSDDCSSVAFW